MCSLVKKTCQEELVTEGSLSGFFLISGVALENACGYGYHLRNVFLAASQID